MSIEIKNLDKLIGLAERYPRVSVPILNKAIVDSIGVVDAYQRGGSANTPVRTSHLKNDWKNDFSVPLQGKLWSLAYYGIFVNNGTFKMKANPFWDRTMENCQKPVNLVMNKAISDIIKSV